MSLVLNVLWLVFGGLIAAVVWFVTGIIYMISIIGIPIGLQYFKFSRLMLSPFGKEVVIRFDKHPVINTIWAIILGWIIASGYLIIGLLWSISIIGIPVGLQWFKFSKLALFPVGAEIR